SKCVAVHGITYEDVKSSPKFPEVWAQIKRYFEENYIIAHNARFDMSVLKNCLFEYGLDIPDFKYFCSILISAKACTSAGKSLKERTKYFGIELNNHHNALEDAKACAQIVIETIKRCRNKSFENFLNVYSSIEAKEFKDLKPQISFGERNRYKRFERISVSEIAAATETFNEMHPFFRKNIVFTGELSTMSRRTAMQKAVNAGAILKSGVSRNTDFLVVGTQDKSIVGDDGLSSKEAKAYKLIDEGYDIKIINEEEFLRLLED
ncbi:MAG: exonuclease, partial [Clostridiaceae bacterium]|nr:exonuclease [Clostridiaceae bacterium]